jgi:tetratricopeptide (TPR) repeat protein
VLLLGFFAMSFKWAALSRPELVPLRYFLPALAVIGIKRWNLVFLLRVIICLNVLLNNCFIHSMKKFLSILSCLTLMLMIASAQNVPFTKEAFKDDKEGFKKAKDALREGDDFYERGEFIKAISPYAIAQAFNPNNDLLNYKLGCCVLVSAQPHKSLPFLQKALELNPTVDKNILANLGKAYQLNLMWDKAISCYSDYLKNTKPEKEKADNIAKWINECENGKELVANPVRVFIDNVGPAINSSFPDYTPVISADESQMVFTSRRDNSTGGGHDQFDFCLYEIYTSS